MANLFRKVNLSSTILSGFIAGISFCVPVYFYIKNSAYADSWLLYLGCFCFGIAIWIHTWRDSQRRGHNESTVALIFASHVCTILGIAVACLGSFLLLTLMVPDYLSFSNAGKTLANEPTNVVHDKTDGLSFHLFMTATFINFSFGSFCAIILSFAAKRNQKKDQRDPAPLHQHGGR